VDVFFTCEVGTLSAVPVSICRSYRRLGLSNIFPNYSLPRLLSYLQYRGKFQRTTGLERVLDLEKMAIECRETFTSAVTCPEPRGRLQTSERGYLAISNKNLMKILVIYLNCADLAVRSQK